MELTSLVSPHSCYDGVNLGEDHLALPKRVTVTEEGRPWFGRGWFHILNYNHEEAVSCFMRCLEVDPACMMAHWGIAYALSSNYNFDVGLGCGYDSIQAALVGIKADETAYSELEKDLVMALTFRSSEAARAAVDPAKLNLGNSMELNVRFADEMAKLYAKYPDDVDVIAVYADATMVLKPWALWRKDDVSGEVVPADDNTLKVKGALARAMKLPGGMEHPAILHLYCHLMELSSEPQAADKAANALRELFPAAGHLTHMASHIDIWAGRYKEALDVNVTAINADNLTVNFTGVKDNFYKAYRIHNLHMVVWAAMFTGEQSVAMHYARELDGLLPPGDDVSGLGYKLFGCIPFGSLFLEPYTLTKWHAMVRFGLWDVILAEPLYEDSSVYATGLASGYYARGIAFASKGLIAEAEAEQAKYHEAMNNPALEGRMMHNNVIISEDAPCVLKVGESMLAGEIEYRKGNAEVAFEHMREAVRWVTLLGDERRDVGLAYDEPWGWMVPAEHALGALLLEHGHVEEATSVFRSNLDMYKENMWGLLGLYQCLEKAGDPEAVDIKRRFDVAAERSEVKPVATCFCAQASGATPPEQTRSACRGGRKP